MKQKKRYMSPGQRQEISLKKRKTAKEKKAYSKVCAPNFAIPTVQTIVSSIAKSLILVLECTDRHIASICKKCKHKLTVDVTTYSVCRQLYNMSCFQQNVDKNYCGF